MDDLFAEVIFQLGPEELVEAKPTNNDDALDVVAVLG